MNTPGQLDVYKVETEQIFGAKVDKHPYNYSEKKVIFSFLPDEVHVMRLKAREQPHNRLWGETYFDMMLFLLIIFDKLWFWKLLLSC